MFPDNTEPVQDPNNPQAQPEGRNAQNKPKKPRENITLKPQLFETKKGIRSLYERTKELKLDDHSEINIENTMKKIVVLLKTWHFQMLPKYSFDYFIQRCQVLGSHKRISAYMSKVRKIHKGQDVWEEIVPQQTENQENKPQLQEEQQELYNGRMFQQTNQALKMMNEYAVQPATKRPQIHQADEQDEDDEQLMELMYKVEKKQMQNNEEMQSNQPYVPEGFQVQYQDQQ